MPQFATMTMRWTPDLADPELFHITHVDNLASIALRGLLADVHVTRGPAQPVTIGDVSIKQRRQSWTLNRPDRPACSNRATSSTSRPSGIGGSPPASTTCAAG
jgi:hypothetical protein